MLGGRAALVVDTRSTLAQGREILDDLRELGSPRVGIVVNTHGHSDHCFGNSVFRPATIWGHERCVTMIRTTGEAQRASAAQEIPDIAGRPRRGRARSARSHVHRSRDPRPRRPRSSSSPTSGAGTPTTTSWSRSPTPTCCASATCSRTALRRGSATATRWTGRRRPGRSSSLIGERTVVVPGHGAHADRAFVERSIDEIARDRRPRATRPGRRGSPRDDAVGRGDPIRPAAAREAARAALAPASRRARSLTGAGAAYRADDAHHPAAPRLAVDDRVERGLERRRA